jgi:hypothetical protein
LREDRRVPEYRRHDGGRRMVSGFEHLGASTRVLVREPSMP